MLYKELRATILTSSSTDDEDSRFYPIANLSLETYFCSFVLSQNKLCFNMELEVSFCLLGSLTDLHTFDRWPLCE